MCAGEEFGDGLEGELGDVEAGLVGLVLAEEVLVPELPVDLLPGADEGDSVDAGHDSLLDGLALDVTGQLPGQRVVRRVFPLDVLLNHFYHHF